MKRTEKLFLEAFRASIKNEQIKWKEEVSMEELPEIFEMAERHHVLAEVYEAAGDCQSAGPLKPYRLRAITEKGLSYARTEGVLRVLEKLSEAGIENLLLKGYVKDGILHVSGREDILVREKEHGKAHRELIDMGFAAMGTEKDVVYVNEIMEIRLLKKTFMDENHGELFKDAEMEEVSGVKVCMPKPGSHMLYLIHDGFRAFLHGDCGIIKIRDICMYADINEENIDWTGNLECLRRMKADGFAEAAFKIGSRYLGINEGGAGFCSYVDMRPLLDDILKAEDDRKTFFDIGEPEGFMDMPSAEFIRDVFMESSERTGLLKEYGVFR